MPEQVIGDRVRARRLLLNMTQEELAQAAGLSMFTINRIENRKHPRTEIGTVRKLAEALGIHPGDLM